MGSGSYVLLRLIVLFVMITLVSNVGFVMYIWPDVNDHGIVLL